MMKNNDTQLLETQLREAGASPDEAHTLARYGHLLHMLKDKEPRVTHDMRLPLARQLGRRRRVTPLIASLFTIGSLTIGLAVASIAQIAYPGNLLYPVKRLTENVAVIIQPNYRGTLMMRRAVEVKQLVTFHQNPKLINTTLQSYKTEASDYYGGDYADYEYCESTLVQAEHLANGTERLAIAKTIASVKAETD
jgi:hypothetical protein